MNFTILLQIFVGFLIRKSLGKDIETCQTVPSRNDSGCEQNIIKEKHNFNLYKSIVDLYDHFNWNIKDIEKLVSKSCANDMKNYLKALNENTDWAIKGKQIFKNQTCFYC